MMPQVTHKSIKSGNEFGLKRLLTSKEAAEYLGISPKTLWVWSRGGLIPMVHFEGTRVKYDIRDIERVIENNKIFEK